jgi:peptide deformylase
MKILLAPDPWLSKQVTTVDINNPGFDPEQVKHEMVTLMTQHEGMGLSANQVGLDHQLFVIGDSVENSTLCINPKVRIDADITGSEIVTDYEGCLSFPMVFVKLSRPDSIITEFYNEKLELVTEHLTGYTARCYLHELDHLMGVTFKDRCSKLKWDMATKKSKKLLRA